MRTMAEGAYQFQIKRGDERSATVHDRERNIDVGFLVYLTALTVSVDVVCLSTIASTDEHTTLSGLRFHVVTSAVDLQAAIGACHLILTAPSAIPVRIPRHTALGIELRAGSQGRGNDVSVAIS
jgi:NADH:ubiquinone oxidoreductase subunit H